MIFLSGKNDVLGSISCCDYGGMLYVFEGDRRKMNRGKRKGRGVEESVGGRGTEQWVKRRGNKSKRGE